MSHILRLKDSVDVRKTVRLIDNLVAKPITYQIKDNNLIFNDEDDLLTVRNLLSNKGIFNMMQKTAGRVFLTYTELQDLKQVLMDKLYTVVNRMEIKDIYTYPELVDWMWRNAKKKEITAINSGLDIKIINDSYDKIKQFYALFTNSMGDFADPRLALEIDGKFAGGVAIDLQKANENYGEYKWDIAIKPAYRGKGYSKMLIDAMIKDAYTNFPKIRQMRAYITNEKKLLPNLKDNFGFVIEYDGGNSEMYIAHYDLNQIKKYIDNNKLNNNKDMKKQSIEIPKEHLNEDTKEFDKIDSEATNIKDDIKELKKDDTEAMKKESMAYWTNRQSEVAKDSKRIVKSSINVTGAIEEIVIDELLADAMSDITVDNIESTDSNLTVEQPSADTINPEQSMSQILQQLKVYFLDNYKNDYTYDNIVKSAQETGLLNALDTSDLFGLFNKLAIEVGLPRTDWSQFVSDSDSAEETMIADISKGKESGVGYNEDNVDINGIMEGYDNAPDNLFVIDRILEERYNLEPNSKLEPIVDEAKEIVKNSLKQVKKDCSVIQYTMNNVKVDKINNSGVVVAGKVLVNVKLQFLKKGKKVVKSIEMSLPIKNGKPQASKEFTYVNASYPLQTYYVNNLIDK